MGRKPNNTSTVNNTVEVKEKNQDIVDGSTEVVTEKKAEETKEKKAKPIKDDDDVVIICKSLAGKSVVTNDAAKPILFDEEGKATVKGIDAKYLLTIPCYSLA